MRIGVFYGNGYHLRPFAQTLTTLLEHGHELMLALPSRKAEEGHIPSWLDDPRVSLSPYPEDRADGLSDAAKVLRSARDFLRYERGSLRDAEASRERARDHLLRLIGGDSAQTAGVDEDSAQLLGRVFERVEELIPADPGLCRHLTDEALDSVFCISRVNIAARQPEVIKAARALGIPSVLAVYSWDNLSSKGLIHVPPDRLLVWNDIQVREAIDLHGVQPDRVEALGAPVFDDFFELRPSADRQELLATFGLDPDRATLLYLGSSGFVSRREPEFVDRWAAALRAAGEERIRGANILVRPHPGMIKKEPWVDWQPAVEGVVVPKVRRTGQSLYDQLSVADAVVALNTSAEIEAAIADRPVLTLPAGELAPGQEGSAHFRYLLADEGGFVEVAGGLDDHLAQLGRALAEDPHSDERRQFLARFVRPRGLDRPVGPLLAAAVEQVAAGQTVVSSAPARG